MHGREGEWKRRRHMRPVPPPGDIAASASATLSLRPPPVSSETPSDSFLKDGRQIRVGDCALFQAGNAPPFIGIIRQFSKGKEDHLKLCVNWLYRPADIKLAKGILLDAAPNEVFYSFHKDVIPTASLLHPCKVAFLQKGVELPLGIPSFVCRRVYDIANKRLWWLTDKDYINEHQEEVDQLLNKTWLEMHAAVQSGGRSPKSLNAPASTQQLKSGSDSIQNSGTSFSSQTKGKKRLRSDQAVEHLKGDQDTETVKRDQVTEPIKREHSTKSDDGDSVNSISDNMKTEIAKITDKGGLVSMEGVEKLVDLMHLDRSEKKIDLACRIMLADVIAATDKNDCLGRFVQLKGVPVLDDWLQEVHKGKTSDGSSPRESDKIVDDFLFSLLHALEKLPVNLNALQTCNIGKSVNNLRNHKNLEIQKKARNLVDTWKKRVDAELSKIDDAKSVGSSQPVSWPVKPGCSDVSHAGNKRTGSTEVVAKMPVARSSACKSLSSKPGVSDSTMKSVFPASVAVSSKDPHGKTASSNGGSESIAVTVKEEKSSGSNQSQNNHQSCSSDQAKIMASSWKEEARSSTAGLVNTSKLTGGSSHNRRSSNGILGTNLSGIQKETHSGRSGSVNKVMTSEKASQSGPTCEKPLDTVVGDHGNNSRLIVRLPNPGRSPGHSATGCSSEDPLVMGSRSSSPGISDKQDHNDQRVKRRSDVACSHISSDAKSESWQGNDVKEGLVGSEGVRSSTAILDEEHSRNIVETGNVADATRTACSSPGNENGVCLAEPRTSSFSSIHALVESCAKYSEASTPFVVGDDTGMNLLATVATGVISKSDLISLANSLGTSPEIGDPSTGNDNSRMRLSSDDDIVQRNVRCDEATDAGYEKQEKSVGFVLAMDLLHQEGTNITGNIRNDIQKQESKSTIDPTTQSTISCIGHNSLDSPMKVEVNLGEETVDGCFAVHKKGQVVEHDSDGASPLEGKQLTGSQVSDICTDDKPNLMSPSINDKSFECYHKKIGDGSICTSDTKIGDRCDLDVAASDRKSEMPLVGEPMSTPVAKGALGVASSTDQQQPPSFDAVDESVDAIVSLPVGSALSPNAADESKTRNSDISGINQLELGHEAKDQSRVSRFSIDEPIGSAAASLVIAESVGDPKEVHESHPVGSTIQEGPHTSTAKQIENFAKSSRTSGFDADGMEVVASSAEPCLLPVLAEQDVSNKLEFDLNEGIPEDDGNQGQPDVSAAIVCSSAIPSSSLSPFANPMSNCLPASITVASPAKGPFFPPEILLKTKGEPGWKGSAATSAFRPAEPRKVLEMPANGSDNPPSHGTGKQGRLLLDIDLNIADERILEETASQNSVQTTVSTVGFVSTHDTPTRTAGGVDLDLNRVDDDMENRQFLSSTSHRLLEVSILPIRPASEGFPGGESNVLRNFDLNDRPGLGEVGVEPIPRGQQANNTSYVPFLAPVAGHRTSNSEFGCVSSYFHPNSYPAVAIPSFLPDRGEQSNPVVATLGFQRTMGSVTGAGNLGTDIYRGPVLSSSPAVAFSPATAYSYSNLPFPNSFPLASTSFSGGSTPYVDSSSVGGSCYPAFPSPFVGPVGAVSSHFPRPYLISFPEGSASSVSDNNLKWSRQGFDLNTGPGSGDMEAKDERLPSSSRQLLVASSQVFMEEQARTYTLPGVGSKRKEPEGSWDADRSAKQLSWK
ncbi:hypothetical protein C4D60_Mb03t06000 [Musa balbisiana]|uniref:BAH domain-containing protein n=1 Tax=Musa balbisiana TaxID=52838 RepID=A0A4S8J9L0_MUSBA|nr:hypothetical protein C4D60_Mb03t06000 [Musa balbisiana]